MGLDQHAHLRNAKIDWAKYYSEEEYSGEPQVFVWRKHARLQQFMAVKYAEQNPQDKDPGSFNLGFLLLYSSYSSIIVTIRLCLG